MPGNIFVVGLDDFNRARLDTLGSGDGGHRFHPLLTLEEVTARRGFPLDERLEQASRIVSETPGGADAIIGYWDFPVSLMVPLLCRRFDLTAPSFESVLRCEHKYWSRLEQKQAIPDHVPAFAPVNPFDDESVAGIPLAYPYWIKPVKSAASHLGFRIRNRKDLARAVTKIRAEIGRIAEPFKFVLRQANLPPEVEGVDGYHCIAEEIISGRECTLEGWVYQGELGHHGIVDSVRERNRSTFARYEYPSLLPARARAHMVEVGRRILKHVGFDSYALAIVYIGARSQRELLERYRWCVAELPFEIEPIAPDASFEVPGS